ncbi:hypothetical protein ARMGADRAFT_1081184 [Armillaria gallica]|uniref:Fungal-type protein kinase domain-containing protein n=1 Tax=Armillaria gallica TaxID=47427 RepID=A0A2H3D923_ARMGA|nr:hypothetical protein ARMGADRAFT_1081184 [Armillaria gallica]
MSDYYESTESSEQLDLLQTLDDLSCSGLSVERWVKYIFGMSMAEIALVRSRARTRGMKRRLRQFVDALSGEQGHIGLQQSFQDLWNAIVQDFCREDTCPRFPILAQRSKGTIVLTPAAPDRDSSDLSLHAVPLPEDKWRYAVCSVQAYMHSFVEAEKDYKNTLRDATNVCNRLQSKSTPSRAKPKSSKRKPQKTTYYITVLSREFRVSCDDIRLGALAQRCMSATYRMHVCLMSLQGVDMTLHYYDPMGSIRSVPFNIIERSEDLLLVIWAMCNRLRTQAGFNPFQYNTAGEWKESQFVFEDCDTKEELVFVATDEPLFVSGELLGRRSLILPVTDALGRILVLKFPWVLGDSSVPETELIKEILRLAPEIRKHLPDLQFSRVYDSDTDLHLPQFALPPLEDERGYRWKRDLLIAVTTHYHHLWTARSLQEFKKIFIEIVECHHVAYEKGRVLHRDISWTNLMFDRVDDIPIGILNDWDNSTNVDESGDIKAIQGALGGARGTFVFMAIDLLRNRNHEHFYRHDLESFFYVLVWAAIHFNLKEGTHTEIAHPVLAQWAADADEEAWQSKMSFLENFEAGEAVFNLMGAEFDELNVTWILDLREIFADGYGAFEDHHEIKSCGAQEVPSLRVRYSDPAFDEKTLGGHVTFEKFMDILKG